MLTLFKHNCRSLLSNDMKSYESCCDENSEETGMSWSNSTACYSCMQLKEMTINSKKEENKPDSLLGATCYRHWFIQSLLLQY